MITYKLNKGFDGGATSSVNRYDSESTLVLSIPFVADNTDYQEFLRYKEAGGKVYEADEEVPVNG
jgi:hypothetical protein